jgi:hypothetical protein
LKKNPSQKRAGEVAQGVGPEFKPQYCRKEKKRKERNTFLFLISYPYSIIKLLGIAAQVD